MRFYWLVLLAIVTTLSCSHPPYSHSPSNFKQPQLEKLSQLQRSILKITCSANYQNYFYANPSGQADTSSQKSLLISEDRTTTSVAGTGLIVSQKLRKMVLLTCYHLFDFQDTLKTFYLNKQRQPTGFLHSLSIKLGVKTFVTHISGRNSLGRMIAADRENDLALIETTSGEIFLSESPFAGRFGDAEAIKLGQEVYLLGFPGGYFMITRGLASLSQLKGEFMIDAPFNRGFSGGAAILFTKEGDYELVGIANAVGYDPQTVLAPVSEPNISEKYGDMPYDGEIYVKDLRLIKYGITFVIKSNVILDFLFREKEVLRGLGYDLPVGIREQPAR